MGNNDAGEMLAAAQADNLRLEREIAQLRDDLDQADTMFRAYRPDIECAIAVNLDEETNWEVIAKWCGGNIVSEQVGKDGEYESWIVIPGVRDVASAGSWIVLNQDGTFSVVLDVRPPTRALSADERTIARRFGLDGSDTTPPVNLIRMREERTIRGEVYMVSILNGREGDDEALLENGEYLIGLHVRPHAIVLPEDDRTVQS
jgi:hypothetical protein